MADWQVSDYKEVRERLSILRTIQMPAQRELEISSVLHREIEVHRQRYKGRRSRNLRRTFGWVGSASAAVAVAVFAIGTILVNHGHLATSAHNRTAASEQSHLTVPIHYTSAQLQRVKKVAQAVGVTAWIPHQGLAGDTLTLVKNNGKGILVLDYKHFWITERTSPPPSSSPQGRTKTTHLTIHNVPAEYVVGNNQSGPPSSALTFQQGNTYIDVSVLWPIQAIPLQIMKAVGESFARVR
ncbi:hypothetical protein [Alicyclobacillus sp. ALC3]|uniref:hypothetical protein n=1 Tax=Alicyclobacillus sp. ALC3 TaxID=2796143 RepID=UPI002377DCE5|nr:hypothetical protein [Alicyclobacillus sp. ALC3]WDL96017.1 hypothetical protein JC200_16965 [Alicyclobacillus sp. ALC3]